MEYLLLVTSSLHGPHGHSTRLAGMLAQKLANEAGLDVCTRNLAKDCLPHLNEEELQAWQTPGSNRTAKQTRIARLSDQLIDELKNAQAVVVAMPMYNFSVPSTFKAWVDRITRAGVTFKHDNGGTVGLLESKPVHIVCTRGGFYSESDYDFQTAYLKKVLSFIGSHQIDFVYAEGLNTEHKTSLLHKAKAEITNIK